ncbi:fimbrial protein [Metapseudomonas resinovorans]|uniref:fimbrial protein n=1 Tax=Metapseudomonas resinovorans TaxID=53412 RepID=UPI0009DB9442|nr:fimbrial protein [Pseudomonas resinovorans]MDE3736436.1 fimbrial protein [Pseudomonas resinovorans]
MQRRHRPLLVRLSAVLLATFAVAYEVQANTCRWTGGSLRPSYTLSGIPAEIRLTERVAIGEVMGTAEFANNALTGYVDCQGSLNVARHHYELSGLSEVPGFNRTYATGVEGIGVKLRLRTGSGWDNGTYLPAVYSPALRIYPPPQFRLEFVRTGSKVGSGPMALNFSLNFSTQYDQRFQWTTWGYAGNVALINSAFFSSCEPIQQLTQVPMGAVTASALKGDRAPVKPFAFDVRCKGLDNPGTGLVGVSFEGKSPRAGRLELDSGDLSARGVEIALKDAQGNDLPIGNHKAQKLEPEGEDADGYLYRFSGSAQYIQTSQDIEGGEANASLTYILDYN